MQTTIESIQRFCSEAAKIWIAGGWAMIAIAAVALIMFTFGMHIYFRLWAKGFRWVPERTWRSWIEHPGERRGSIGRLLNHVTTARTVDESVMRFHELRTIETAAIARDLRVMMICIGLAPLLGLLGTVMGMLTTFDALSSGSGGEKTMGLIARGISEALITTETGLVIALPGLFFQYQLARTFDRYKTFLAHLESVCSQSLYRTWRRAHAGDPPMPARRPKSVAA